MLPGATLFGVALVMIIVASLAFLLVRKPSLSFGGISTETPRLKTKSRKIKDETKKASKMHACPKYLGYLEEIPKNSRIPNECLTCSKMVECQGLNAFDREEASEKTVKTTQTVKKPEKLLEQVKPQKIIEEKEVPTAPKKHTQERPPGCLHFFGYLRNMPKNTLIPDECLRCSKMVECQELNAYIEEASEKTSQVTQTVKEPEKLLEQVKPQKIIEEKEVPTAPKKHTQERPPGCLHFFGYLRNMPKNTLIPDECLRCSKIVECLYHTVLE